MSTIQACRLLESLSILEDAVFRAKNAVKVNRGSDPEMLARLDCYLEVVRRQKGLALSLQEAIKQKDMTRAERFAELIRGSSRLIQLEAESFIKELLMSGARDDFYQA